MLGNQLKLEGFIDTILGFQIWSRCDVKEWNSEYLELLEKTKDTQY